MKIDLNRISPDGTVLEEEISANGAKEEVEEDADDEGKVKVQKRKVK